MSFRQHLPARKTVVAGVVGLTVGLLVAGGGWWFLGRTSTAQATTPTATTRTVAAATDTIKKTISTSGTLTPAVQQDVSFAGSGTVTSVDVAAGAQVAAGQQLGTIDTLTMQQTLATAKLALAKAQATLVTDQAAVTTAQDAQSTAADAGDDTTAADAKVATATAQIGVDQNSITSAQADVDAAQTALDSATLVAPIAGIVSTVNVVVGQKVSATDTGSTASGSTSSAGSSASGAKASGSTSSGSSGASGASGSGSGSGSSSSSSSAAAYVIVGTDSWKVDVTVDDAQIGLIAVGDQAQLAVTSQADPLFGTITSIGLISTGTTGTASYPVVVTVTGTPTGLHDGTAATVTLIYSQLTNVLTVPSGAVHTVDGQTVVYTMSGGQQVSTPVVVGDTDGSLTQITSGLAEGDEVLVTTATGSGRSGQTGGTTGQTGRGGFTGGTGGAGGFPGGAGGFPGGAGGFPPTGAPAGG